MIRKKLKLGIHKLRNSINLQEVCEHHFLGCLLNRDAVVVDWGANKGVFSKTIIESFKCVCHAVEPSSKVFSKIPAMPGLVKHNFAIGPRNEEINFFISTNEQASSAKLKEDEAIFKERILQINPEDFFKKNLINRIDLLKVDIEGLEIEVFKSISDKYLMNQIDQITIEYHDFINYLAKKSDVAELRNRLKEMGYREYLFGLDTRMDCLYVHRRIILTMRARITLRFLEWIMQIWRFKRWLLNKKEK